MKFRNKWKAPNKQWDKVMIRFRISLLDIFCLELDISRRFYLFTILNYTIKNR